MANGLAPVATLPVSPTQTSDINETPEVTKQKAAKGDTVAQRKLAKLKGSASSKQAQATPVASPPAASQPAPVPPSADAAALAVGKGKDLNTVA